MLSAVTCPPPSGMAPGMNDATPIARAADSPPLPLREFVPMIAALMSLSAMGIDSMLPALPDIARRLHVADLAQRPLVITFFVVGLGVGQLIQGPLTDRFGRRPVMIAGLSGYIVGNLLAALSASFTLLLAARFVSGLAVAAGRVVTIALIRDCFSGRAMARVSSLAFMVFMLTPVVAPSVGQAVLLIGSWRLIFEVIAAAALSILLWFAWRMPETLRREDRVPISLVRLRTGWRLTLTDRNSFGYTMASIMLQAGIFGYLGSIQPIMQLVYHRPGLLGAVFAVTAVTMAAGNLLNSRIVMRLGMRRISQGALLVLILSSGAALVAARLGAESLPLFVVLQSITLTGFVLANSNMSAMAMENVGAIAGTASSVQGFVGIISGAVLGALTSAAFDGTAVPLHAGFLIGGVAALAIALLVERGRRRQAS